MADVNLGKLLGAGVINDIEAKLDDVLDVVTTPVKAGAFDFKSFKLDLGQPSIDVFQTPVKLTAVLTAAAKIDAPEATFALFPESGPVAAGEGNSFAELTITAKASASATGAGKLGVLQLSGEAAANAALAYTHRLPVAGTATRLDALRSLVLTSELPQRKDVTRFVAGESIDFNASLNVDFGLSAKYGKGLDLDSVVRISDGLSAPIKAHAAFSLSAALGFSLYDEIHLIVARAAQRNPNWVRARLDRAHRDRITFGVAFNLAITYDASQAAKLLLDKIYALVPMPELDASLSEFLTLAAAGKWSDVGAKISAKAADVVGQLIDNTGWKQLVENSPEVQKLVATATWVVKEYSKLDDKVKSLWEELLARVDDAGLKKFRDLIQEVASIEVDQIDIKSLTNGQLTHLIELIEALSGHDIEELVISGSLKEAITRAVDVAKRVNAAIASAPEDAIARIHAFAQKSGIEGVINWLKANATSVANLEKAADTWIASVVERLVGKALSQIDANDLAPLQKFAQKAEALINALPELEKKLTNAADKLKGQFGVNLALEFGRISEWSSVVDIEIDPTNPAAVDAITRFLPSGDVQQLLGKLDSINPTDGKLPFDIRDLLLTSRHIRTSTTALLISFLGLDRSGEDRIEESAVRVSGGGATPLARRGIYSGGSVVRMINGGATTEGGAWTRFEGTASDASLDNPYTSVVRSVRISYVREDPKTTADELIAITTMLIDVGFMAGGAVFSAPAEGAQTRFSMEIDLPGDAMDKLIEDIAKENEWNTDARNAGFRWFKDKAADFVRGGKLAAIVTNAKYGELWTLGSLDDFDSAARHGDFGFVAAPLVGGNWFPEFAPAKTFAFARGGRYRGYATFEPPQDNTPAKVAEAAHRGARLFATGGTEWQLPLFNFWLVLARLSRTGATSLGKAHGLASFRSRPDDKSEWSTPQFFTIEPPTGIWSHLKERFPLKV